MNHCALYTLSHDEPTVKKLVNQVIVVFLASLIIWLAHRRWRRLQERIAAQKRYDNGLQVRDIVVIQHDGKVIRGTVTRKRPGWTAISTKRGDKWMNYGLLDSDFTILVLTRAKRSGVNANGLQ